jgi:hypothetical protein
MNRKQAFALQPFADEPASFRSGVGDVALAQRFEQFGKLQRDSNRPIAGVAVPSARLTLASHAAIFSSNGRHSNHHFQPANEIIGEYSLEINR